MSVHLSTHTGTGGRPTKEAARRRDERILRTARQAFLERGYSATTLEAIARDAGTAKKTVYRQFGDKAALFVAVVSRLADEWASEVSAIGRDEAGLEAILRRLALRMIEASSGPQSVALHRAVIAEAVHFPELARCYEAAFSRSLATLAELLVHEAEAARLDFGDGARLAAEQFVAVTGLMVRRRALLGFDAPEAAEQGRLADRAVALFLNGYRSEPARAAA